MTAGTHIAEVVGAKLTKSRSGTPGLWLRCVVGTEYISDTRYITAKTREQREKELRILGATAEQIRTKLFWSNPMAVFAGRKVEIVVEEEDGKLRVKWINAVVADAEPQTYDDVIAVFGTGDNFAATDEDVPF